MGQDYVPLDLTPSCNTPVGAIGAVDVTERMGHQLFRGIPFRVGRVDEAGDSLIVLDGESPPIDVPIHDVARSVVFAHRLLESSILDGGPVGRAVARLDFGYSDGSAVQHVIRERFEIGHLEQYWGHPPFLALPDQLHGLPPRDVGRWQDTGVRQSGIAIDVPVTYFVWAWMNPRPDVAIDGLRISPLGPRMLLAGITIGHADEHPLRIGGARLVKLMGRSERHPATAAEVDLAVDRGVASFTHRLPGTEPAGREPLPGWGTPANTSPLPAFARVAAVPSATLSVSSGGVELGSTRWADVMDRTPVEVASGVTIEVVAPDLNWVRTSVVDAQTREPLACRLSFRSADGIPYQPHGHHDVLGPEQLGWHLDVGGDIALGGTTFAYVDGSCEGWLPRGTVAVQAASGFEYEPLDTTVAIGPGQTTLELALQRSADMNRERWFSGDTHVHFLSTTGAIFEARAEGLNVVNLLQTQWGRLFTGIEDFTGEPHVSRDGRTIAFVGQENRHRLLGHLSLLGVRKPVLPLSIGEPHEANFGDTVETVLGHWADRARREGGTVIAAHLPYPNGEFAALIGSGRVDAAEMVVHARYRHLEYYRYLNAGYRLPLVGGTDKMSNAVPMGLYRTYVRIPEDEPFNYDTWCSNLRLGRTFVSGGPLLRLSVEGRDIGDEITLPRGGAELEVDATAKSILPIHTLQLIVNGEIVGESSASSGTRRLRLKQPLRIDAHSWVAARCSGPGYWGAIPHFDEWSRGIMAHTSPIYVGVGGPWRQRDADTDGYMITLIEGGLAYLRELSPQFPEGSAVHAHGAVDHMAYLEQPYHEALAAIRQRGLQE